MPACPRPAPTPSPGDLLSEGQSALMGWEATGGSGSAEAAAALLAQVEGSDVRHKSDFFLLQQGQKFRLRRPHL